MHIIAEPMPDLQVVNQKPISTKFGLYTREAFNYFKIATITSTFPSLILVMFVINFYS